MRARSRKYKIISSLVFLLFCLAVVTAYFTGKNAESPNNALEHQITQNSIVLDSVLFVDTNLPASAEQHQTIKVKIEQSLKGLRSVKIKKPDDKARLDKLIDAEQAALDKYSKTILNFYKPLSFNPADDLDDKLPPEEIKNVPTPRKMV